MEENKELINCIVKGMEELKGQDIKILNLCKIENSISSYFIICSGNSNTHVAAIAGAIRKFVSKTLKQKPWKTEGEDNSLWVLMDYVDVVVHVFQEQTRKLYNLESLWGDAEIEEPQPLKT